ncbi:LysM peptidoglycan-binding domain-containing protein [Ahrensia kielensis]|uniref:LysM peptidoglycan-binding domain-containing protein n=1 Tax=Ahrensia kielensis TaxID=76980 RepID=UPI00035EAC07|nr:LysM peptidoglycan-binding domain-containing protein [Ahrensia kielensis]
MGKESIGVWLFAGIVGITGLVASGYLGDPNKLLEPFKSVATSTETPQSESNAAPKSDRTVAPEAEESTALAEISPEVNDVSVAAESEEASPSAKAPQDAKAEIDTAASEEVAAAPEAEQTIAEPAAPVETASENIVPTFDILRVEPNGDMVIAGIAASNADVEIVAGSKSLAITKSNDRGEFVAILDEPLKQGDYTIVLRTTRDDGTVATSLETAIVSIPEKGSTDVLALVEAPGAPSRLITKSEVGQSLQVVETPTQAEPKTDDEIVKDNEAEKTASSIDEPAEVKTTMQSEEVAPQQKAGEVVRIEAVEIDGAKVFVAGATDAGARIRVYANEIILGEDLANSDGRFLVEANRDLPIGDYVIRADRLSKNGFDVVARAAVPFTRSEGEKLAAVAVPQALAGTAPSAPVETAAGEDDQAPSSDMSDASETSPKGAMVEADSADGVASEAETDGVQVVIADETPLEVQATGNVNERLKPVDTSVIIRRGDTLWHISKRVYGRGIKYTTIYKANEDQIENPDKIWPGQIFALPENEESSEATEN